MLDPTTDYIMALVSLAVGITALAVFSRAVVGTASSCMSISLKAVEFGERVKCLFSRQSAEKQPAAEGVAKALLPTTSRLPVTPKAALPVTSSLPAENRGVAKGRQSSSLNDSGPPEGVAKGSPTSASGLPVTRKPGLPVRSLPASAGREWRPLATPHRALPAPVIPDADAAMRFRLWMLEVGLEQINRGHGELIATIDLWELAQRFAQGSGFRIESGDRFFEALRKLPGVHKEENRWVTRLRGVRQKRVAYSFHPGNVANRKAVRH